MTQERLETGVPVVDEHLDGGLPSGTITAVVAPPGTQSELLLYQLAAQRPTLYLSTRRNEESVRDAFERADLDIEDSMIAYADPDADLDEVGSTISRVGAEHNLIIDPANPLERWDPQVYQQFLNRLHTYIRRTESIAVVHCHTAGDALGREVTLGIADVVLRLDQTVSADTVESTLVVSKFRGGRALTEPITLELTDDVTVDTTRKVA